MSSEPYFRPARLDEALSLRAGAAVTPLAGGTDLYPAMADGARAGALLDLSRIEDFPRSVERAGGDWLISPRVTWSGVARAPLGPRFDCLREAAVEVGGWQIQNRGTVVGNVCNASPAADGIVALLALDGRVRLASPGAQRTVPLEDFLVGNRQTVCGDDELVTAVQVPDGGGASATGFAKLGSRRYLVISIAMAAVMLRAGRDGRIERATVAVGACGPRAVRLAPVEDALVGMDLEQTIVPAVAEVGMGALAPIDDVRGSAAYRLAVVPRLVAQAAERARRTLLVTS